MFQILGKIENFLENNFTICFQNTTDQEKKDNLNNLRIIKTM